MPEETARRDRVVRQPARRAAATSVRRTRSPQVRVGRRPAHRPTARHRPVDGRCRPAATRRARRRARPGAAARAAGRPPTEKKNAGSHRRHRSPDGPRDGRRPAQRPEVDTPHHRQGPPPELCKLGTGICARTVARLLKKIGFSLRVNHKKRGRRLASEPRRPVPAHRRAARALRRREHAGHQRRHQEEGTRRRVPQSRRQVGPQPRTGQRPRPFHPRPRAAPSPTASTTRAPMPAPSSSAKPPTPRRSPSTASRSGGAPKGTSTIPRPKPCRSWPTGAAATVAPRAPGSSTCSIASANRHGLRVTVAHYPPATSKWNPIEHRLFCVVSKNWAGRPLDSYETILKYLRTTRTATGLRVRAHLVAQDLQDRRQGHRRADAGATHHTEQLPPQMELHHRNPCNEKTEVIFCSGPKRERSGKGCSSRSRDGRIVPEAR